MTVVAGPAPLARGGRLPASRWRAAPRPARAAADRVRVSHRQARSTLRIAFVFIAAAALAAAAGQARWLPLHLFLGGGVALAISGVSVMLTVTWSAAPAPPDWIVRVQCTCVAAGAAGVAAGRRFDLGPAMMASAGSAYLAGLTVLAVLLAVTARRGVERRFDPAVVAYLAAVAAGLAGVALGVRMAVGTPSTPMRAAHVTLNVLGLVGLVVGGTLPFFAATVGRARMALLATRRRSFAAVAAQAVAVAVAATGLGAGDRGVAVSGLCLYAAAIAVALALMPRPTRRQLRWAGPRLGALWAGALWWLAAVAATAVEVARGDSAVLAGRWLLVVVVGGYAQILWGSLAYLVPMLRGGGHEQLGRGFAATRSWLALAAANAAAAALAADRADLAAPVIAVWVVDTAVRVVIAARS